MDEFFKCAECGMTIIGREYHPYTACVLFRQTRQAEKVRSMLHQVALYGYEAAQAGVSVDAALDDVNATAPAAEAERILAERDAQEGKG